MKKYIITISLLTMLSAHAFAVTPQDYARSEHIVNEMNMQRMQADINELQYQAEVNSVQSNDSEEE